VAQPVQKLPLFRLMALALLAVAAISVARAPCPGEMPVVSKSMTARVSGLGAAVTAGRRC
jgi:hypothetical protein